MMITRFSENKSRPNVINHFFFIKLNHLEVLIVSMALYLVQSDLGYPATSGPAHIRISDLAGYERYA